MPAMKDIRSYFRRRLPRFDLRGDQPWSLLAAGPSIAMFRGRNADGDATAPTGAGDDTNTQRRPAESAANPILDRLQEHHDARTRHESALLERLDPLRDATEALPLVAQKLNELMSGLAAQARANEDRDDAIRSMLGRLELSSGQQAKAMGSMAQQVSNSAKTTDELARAIGDLRCVVAELSQSQDRNHEAVSRLTDAIRTRDTEFAASMNRLQRWMVATVACAAAATVAAVTTVFLTLAL